MPLRSKSSRFVDRPGAVLGPYVLESCLGAGGTSTVWRATNRLRGEPVALKIMEARLDEATRLAVLGRFRREARLVQGLAHPNVVAARDHGLTPDGRAFLVMELVRGEALDVRLARSPSLGAHRFLRAILDVLAGLDAIHRAGLLHRDVKPANVILCAARGGWLRPRLVDFGLCRPYGPPRADVTALTKASSILGTPAYMAPEQARNAAEVDVRSDLYAVGVILYEAFTGRLPFDGKNGVDVMLAAMRDDVVPVELLRPELEGPLPALIARAMARNPADRFESAAEMAACIRRLLRMVPDVKVGSSARRSLPRPLSSVGGDSLTDVSHERALGTSQPRVVPPPAHEPTEFDDDAATELDAAPTFDDDWLDASTIPRR